MSKEQNMNQIYAIYKGDEFLFVGTKSECAAYLGVSLDTIYFYSTPAHWKRREKSNNALLTIKLDDYTLI